ncbi:unnamed protein product [Gordionus sp. m RMFG-2023]|uniref:uncharacterized protein LOC135922241 n=1 Tax=Gordionus sp. m RMFG-2023 TaxID=3053472 RepID=UPI0030DE597D
MTMLQTFFYFLIAMVSLGHVESKYDCCTPRKNSENYTMQWNCIRGMEYYGASDDHEFNMIFELKDDVYGNLVTGPLMMIYHRHDEKMVAVNIHGLLPHRIYINLKLKMDRDVPKSVVAEIKRLADAMDPDKIIDFLTSKGIELVAPLGCSSFRFPHRAC